jgi:hypothetical protein
MKLIDATELLKNEAPAKSFSPEMLVVGKGFILSAEENANERDLAIWDILREAADSVRASLAETDISDSRREYREGLERRLRSLANRPC